MTAAVVLLLAAATAAAADPALVITSPTDYQVFQRQSRGFGKVLISGRVPADCDRVDALLFGDWNPLPLDRSTHTFRAELSVASGGFYSLTIKAYWHAKPMVEARVAHVGVGEVFVIAGQSNATNYGEVKQQTRTGMVAAFDGEGWRVADDPQPGVQDGSKGGSFIPPFGDALYERLHVPIGVVSWATDLPACASGCRKANA